MKKQIKNDPRRGAKQTLGSSGGGHEGASPDMAPRPAFLGLPRESQEPGERSQITEGSVPGGRPPLGRLRA